MKTIFQLVDTDSRTPIAPVKYRFHQHGQRAIIVANGMLLHAPSQMREHSQFSPLSGLRMARPSFVHWKILRNVFIEIQND
ncbi:hypothetical protein [Rhizobium sp. P44RR-XXIV]|uniref:hypothetical protein n=1 Tax=Rhizobium sp. P44RR-XXIV TaxID=1921145 RepID=UPI0010AB4D01|nr:hypothetical protein [Rhizobium sp. P44RR-XXIV]TIX89082.1 hypothetical protein BSK43_020895 [Rhizobium sp. P44RR-XXIV]